MTLAMALAMTLAMGLAGQTQGIRGATGCLATGLAYTTHDVLTASTDVTGDLGSAFEGLAKNTDDTGHF